MIKQNIHSISLSDFLRARVQAYGQLLKFRLSLLVSVSAVFGFAMASQGSASWESLLWIGLGGLLITGASNSLNQLFEKELDAKMSRTSGRPLPEGRVGSGEVLVYALLLSVVGISILGYFFNLPAALLGIIGLLSYAFVYTPLKRITPFAVFVGAIPGSLPPLIGWVAYTGSLDAGGWLLFAFQFFWQFPHFWAIAWIMDEDYQKAGFKMLPTASGKSKKSASLILLYTLCLVPMVLFPLQLGMIQLWSALTLVGLAVFFAFPAWKLHRSLDTKYARKLMFASFLYLPLMELIFIAS
ncbi:MAG: heme o synthase [Bacteroidota bacterium]